MAMFEQTELMKIASRAKTEARSASNRRLKDRLYTLARAADQLCCLLSENSGEGGVRGSEGNDVFFLLQANHS